VDYVWDYYNELAGKINQGETIEIIYTLDESVQGVPYEFFPEQLIYDHPNGAGSIEVNGVNWSARSDNITAFTMQDLVYDSAYFSIHNDWNTPMQAQNINMEEVAIDFSTYYDPIYGAGNQPVDLSTGMPLNVDTLNSFINKGVYLSGNGWNWGVNAQIVSIELISGPGVEIFPAESRLHPMQRFDAAIYLAQMPEVSHLNGVLNGIDISYYLQACNIMPVKEEEQAIVCPDMHRMLMPGDNELKVDVNLIDQSVQSLNVLWTVK